MAESPCGLGASCLSRTVDRVPPRLLSRSVFINRRLLMKPAENRFVYNHALSSPCLFPLTGAPWTPSPNPWAWEPQALEGSFLHPVLLAAQGSRGPGSAGPRPLPSLTWLWMHLLLPAPSIPVLGLRFHAEPALCYLGGRVTRGFSLSPPSSARPCTQPVPAMALPTRPGQPAGRHCLRPSIHWLISNGTKDSTDAGASLGWRVPTMQGSRAGSRSAVHSPEPRRFTLTLTGSLVSWGLSWCEGWPARRALPARTLPGPSVQIGSRGAWVAQSVKRPTSAQVMISRFVGSSPVSGSVLTAQSLELLRILCLPLSLPLPHSHSLSKIDKH